MGNNASQLPDHITSCREEIEREINNGLEDIEESNEILRGIKSLSRRVKLSRRASKKLRLRLGKLGQVVKQCEKLQREYKTKYDQEYENTICDYLQEQLNVTFNMRDEDVRYKELGDVLFYYLMRGEEPDKHVQKIIHRLDYPLYDHTESYYNYSWYELCCEVLEYEETFTQFYKRLDNNTTALEYLLYKQPQLMLNEESYLLLDTLIEHLPYDNLHQIIPNIRDKNGQTCMFYIYSRYSYVKLYMNHIDDWYELLSIRNTTGQTALHVNTHSITYLLALIYTPKQRDAFIKLTSITDNNNQTALQVSDNQTALQVSTYPDLRLLIRQVKNNEYITWSRLKTNVLIIYNTNNRPGAEKEAQIIYNACGLQYDNITLKKNKSEDDIIDCITRSAKENRFGGVPTSLIVILMSHGSVGTIDDYHGNPIKLSDIETAMCCNHLDGKPKMLITQCCQIGEVSEERPPYVPTHDDFCAVMSCVAGQPSERGVFIEKLAEQIKNSKRNTDIFKLVNTVSKEMEREKHKQTLIIMSTLTAQFNPAGHWRY